MAKRFGMSKKEAELSPDDRFTRDVAKDADFYRALGRDDDLGAITRSGTYIAFGLRILVQKVLPGPNVVRWQYIGFERLLELAVAARKIGEDEAPSLLLLNRLRNKFAHDLAVPLRTQDLSDLVNCMSRHQRAFYNTVTIATAATLTPEQKELRRICHAFIIALNSRLNYAPGTSPLEQ